MATAALPHSALTAGLERHVERLLADVRGKCGLRRDTLLERKLERRLASMPAREVPGWVESIVALPASDQRWLDFVEAVTVHETYFFRDLPQLELVRDRVLPELVAARAAEGRRSLRMWSAGCASGEEAYTLAILLLEVLDAAGEVPESWEIDIVGTDLSRRMIGHAREGVFGGPGLNAFRQLPVRYSGCFTADGDRGYRRVGSKYAALVRFHQHNLMSATPAGRNFDLVACRNVLIYFDDQCQVAVQDLLAQALAPRGYLMLGVTDRPARPGSWERITTDNALVFRGP